MKYYCLGIKGTGMSTLAQILFDLGNDVSGYDDAKAHKFTQDGLEKRGIDIYYDDSYELDENTIVTYSVALKEDHKELVRARNSKATIKAYNEVVAEIIDMFTTISVAGTHGKTTTSSLIKHILENTVGCNYFIGAGDGMTTHDNKYFVIESDEFNRHFLAYHPEYSIITNIEAEHLDCYKDIDDIRETFEKFASNTKEKIIACGDVEEVRKINFTTPVIFYGLNEDNDVVVKNVKLDKSGSKFDIYMHDELLGSFELPLYGMHMVLNATAAIVATYLQGIDVETIEKLLTTFKNAKRRFAETFIGDTVIVDDYAHHPTEIKVTLEAVKQKYADKRLVVIFRPNTYSRTADFAKEFAESFKIADKVYLTDIVCNRESASDYPGVTSQLITSKIDGAEILNLEDIDKLKDEKGSVVCFMGCAYVDDLIEAFTKLIKE